MVRPNSVRAELVDGETKPRATLFITDIEKLTRLLPEIIGQLFELTPSKARLAAKIASGATLDIATENLGLTMSSVRT